jgi:hypothetical protein
MDSKDEPIDEMNSSPSESEENPKEKGRTKRVFNKKATVGNYKRKGVSYGSPPSPKRMKVNAVYHDKRMLDESKRSPLHRIGEGKQTKHAIQPVEYELNHIDPPPHLAPIEEPVLPDPVDPKCYKVEMPASMQTFQTEQEAAAHDYYLTHNAATKEAARHVEAKRAEEALTVMEAPKNLLQPNDIAVMRSQVFATVATQTAKVAGVLNGTEKWNAQQVRLYGMLLNKVLPDLHHSYSEVAVQDSDVNKLSRNELEAIIASSQNTEAAQQIVESDYEPSFNTDDDPSPEAPAIITHPDKD